MIKPRELVIHATDWSTVVRWYRDVLGFRVVREESAGYHYANLEHPSGILIGISKASEVDVKPTDRANNGVVMQVEVEDVKAFFAHITEGGGRVMFGPEKDANHGFWFGGIADIEGNPIWVVDSTCP